MIGRVFAAPLHAAQLATGAKSFNDNPILGSQTLNRWGLHTGRVKLAARMAEARRKRLADLVDPADAAAFARDGIVIRHDVLPAELFARLRTLLAERPFAAREMRQGGTVTRFVTLPPELLDSLPDLDALARGALLQGLMRYVGASNADPLVYLHAVFATPQTAEHDPQTTLHSDTFHAAAKAWFFFDDVGEEDGPFTFVKGSHRLTPGRLVWERDQSLSARGHQNRIHSRGSFRASPDEMAAMGYGLPIRCTVPANTLVVADTHGFHARGRPTRASVRPALYASLRRNPFLPWTGLDIASIPGLRGRKAQVWDWLQDTAASRFGRSHGQPFVGDMPLYQPPADFQSR